MNLSSKLSWAAFLVSLSAFNVSPADATVITPIAPLEQSTNPVEDRLEKIASILKAKENQLPPDTTNAHPDDVVASWINTNRGGWRNAGGWRNGGWRNGNWRNGGSFLNRR